MEGRVKFFNENKGYGFLLGNDGKEYFVHISQTAEALINGDICTFEVKLDKKGLQAINVKRLGSEKRPSFIVLGDLSLRLSNIKMYGISQDNAWKVPIFEWQKKRDSFWGTTHLECIKSKEFKYVRYYKSNPYMPFLVKLKTGEIEEQDYPNDMFYAVHCHDGEVVPCFYLYILTFQNEEYRFYDYDAQFDINEKKSELDMLMS